MTDLRFLIAGNWKMNGLASDGIVLAREIDAYARGQGAADCDLLVCPPATLLAPVVATIGEGGVAIGGQDCHPEQSGAYTGSISATMLSDTGATHVIVGHSERRHGLGEDDALVAAKAGAALDSGLCAIVCIGETEAERDSGQTLDVLATQISGSIPDGRPLDGSNIVLAYEPVWAIGTGRTPTLAQIDEAHTHIRARLTDHLGDPAAGVRLLYGGSVKPGNAIEILSVTDVNGALVGGASLVADDFCAIAAATMQAS